MRTRSLLQALVVTAFLSGITLAQTAKKIDNDFVQRTFGKDFTIVPEVGGMVGDVDYIQRDQPDIVARHLERGLTGGFEIGDLDRHGCGNRFDPSGALGSCRCRQN